MCYVLLVKVASRELRNDTAGVLRRAAGGERVQITINGEPVAELGPLSERRTHWTKSAHLVSRLEHIQADSGLRNDLLALAGDTEELGPLA